MKKNTVCAQKLALIRASHEDRAYPELMEWLASTDLSLKGTSIKRISVKDAKPYILRYEFLGTMPGWSEFAFAHLWGERHGGVLLFGKTTGSHNAFCNLFPGKNVLQLQRGVNLWWTPKNSASYFITRACRWLARNTDYDIIVANADEAAGEIGTIYQALNWMYLGITNIKKHPKFVIDGASVHPKTLYDRHGTSAKWAMQEIYGERLSIEVREPKHRYAFSLNGEYSEGYKYPKRGDPIEDFPVMK